MSAGTFKFWLEMESWSLLHSVIFPQWSLFFLYFIDSSSGVQNITISGGHVGTVHTGPSTIIVRESSNVAIGDSVKINIPENESSCKLNNLKISDAYLLQGIGKMVLLFLPQ